MSTIAEERGWFERLAGVVAELQAEAKSIKGKTSVNEELAIGQAADFALAAMARIEDLGKYREKRERAPAKVRT